MQVHADSKEDHIVIRLGGEVEEASYVYDLVQSGRLVVRNKEHLPLPFHGRFSFKLPQRPLPVEIRVSRLEPKPTDVLAGETNLRLVVHCVTPSRESLLDLQKALQDVPPISDEEFGTQRAEQADEFTRVRAMTFPQKVIYATRAGQSGRLALMQQPTPLLLLYLTKNPLISLQELVAIAKMPSIDSLVSESLAKMLRSNPRLAQSEELKMALAINVKTPSGTAISMLRHLNSKSLRKVAKSEVSGSVKNAAVKILLERRD